ncbi:hypothetical protein IAR55_004253 [Kwoniella newhampshirensis]|uniref:Uncharacterized protein n=1 Tax=Kwoniella newhampshirensis TaxID=1651941 RepID=A0AAW0YXJ1_9TREE
MSTAVAPASGLSSSSPPSTPHRHSSPSLPATTTNTAPQRTPRYRHNLVPASVQLFQDRHAAEFAHLHSHRDGSEHRKMIEMEQARLEEERRVGREKRQTMAAVSAEERSREHSRAGWRPLSLLSRRHPVTKPPQLVSLGRQSQPPPGRQQYVDLASPAEVDMTPDLSSPLYSGVYSPDLALITPNQLGLALGCASPQHPDGKARSIPSSSAHESLQSSTYSWASSFSGETVELRAAAHYVPEQPQGEEEVIDSPEKITRRRKRIVALAHTVRQLEGVGSREMEDPNFYHVLVKAWNDRPGHQQQEAIWASSEPIRPRSEQMTAVDPYLAPPALPAPTGLEPSVTSSDGGRAISPSNLERRPPSMNESNDSHSNGSYQSSNPFRYSYASTLHDLALEDGVHLGTKLMSEKAWLRSPLFDQDDYFNAPTPSAPFPTASFQHARGPPSPEPIASTSRLSNSSAESACVPRNEPIRPLRRQKSNISKLRQKGKLDPPIDLSSGQPPNDATNWGLGFLGNWLQEELACQEEEEDNEVDFHTGEDGMRQVQSQMQVEKMKMKELNHSGEDVDHQDEIKINMIEDNCQDQVQDHHNSSMETIDLVLPDPSVPHAPTSAYVQAREYQYSKPCQRQSYSTPSITSYAIPLPHRDIHQTQIIVQTAIASLPSSVEREVEEMAGDGDEAVKGEVYYPSSETYSFPYPPHPHPHHLPTTLLQSPTHAAEEETEFKTPLQPVLPQMPMTPKWQLRRTSYKLLDQNPSSQTTPRPNYDRSSYPASFQAPTGGPIDIQAPDFSVTPHVSPQPAPITIALPQSDSRTDLEKGASMADNSVRPRLTMYLFILGFIIPGLWFFAGWAVGRSSPSIKADSHTTSSRSPTWLCHPDPMVRASRWAAIISTSTLIIAGVVVAIVVTTVRG